MQAAVQIAGVAMVGVLSVAFALLVEWLSLWGLMKLLPPRRPALVPELVVPIHPPMRPAARRFRLRAASR